MIKEKLDISHAIVDLLVKVQQYNIHNKEKYL